VSWAQIRAILPADYDQAKRDALADALQDVADRNGWPIATVHEFAATSIVAGMDPAAIPEHIDELLSTTMRTAGLPFQRSVEALARDALDAVLAAMARLGRLPS